MYRVKTEWKPKVGDKISSCYFEGITPKHYFDVSGSVKAIGINFFIIKPDDICLSNLLIKSDKYHLIEQQFNERKM